MVWGNWRYGIINRGRGCAGRCVVAANIRRWLSTDQLPEGKYDITLSIEDNAAGNRKEEVHEIFIDRTPPKRPVVTYSDIVNDLILAQDGGSQISATQPIVMGILIC